MKENERVNTSQENCNQRNEISLGKKQINKVNNENYKKHSNKNMNKQQDDQLVEKETKTENRINKNAHNNKMETSMYKRNRNDNNIKDAKDKNKNSFTTNPINMKIENDTITNNDLNKNPMKSVTIETSKNKSSYYNNDKINEHLKTQKSLHNNHTYENDRYNIENRNRNFKYTDRNYYRSTYRSDERNFWNDGRVNSRSSHTNFDKNYNRNHHGNRNANKYSYTSYTTSKDRNTITRNYFNHNHYNRWHENRPFSGSKPTQRYDRTHSNEKRECGSLHKQSNDHMIKKEVNSLEQEKKEEITEKEEIEEKEKKEEVEEDKEKKEKITVSINGENQKVEETELISEEEKKKKREEERKKVMSWKAEEQELLEKALKLYRSVKNTPEKWEQISEVVQTRNADECFKRFLYCRSIVLKEQQKIQKEVEELRERERMKQEEKERKKEEVIEKEEGIKYEENDNEEEQDIDSDDMNINNNKNIKGQTLLLNNVELKNVSMYKAVSVKLLLVCTRCVNTFDIIVTSKNKEIVCNCSNCNNGVIVEVYRNICFLGNSCICVLKFNQCSLMDLLTADYSVNCDSCGRKCLLKNVTSGKEMNVNCQKCYSKITFKYKDILFDETVNVNDAAIKKIDDMINKLLSKATIKKKNAANLIKSNVKIEKTKNNIVKINNIEVTNGACKHFKRSYRLFKFPCCNKVFPCPTCHDDKSNHKHQNAKVFICGFCYREFTDSVCMCQNDKKMKKGGKFWEGGKGCRNPIALSRNDPKKYKLLNRQTVTKKKK